METLIINTKKQSIAKIILELVSKIGETGKILDKEEKEDYFFGKMFLKLKTGVKTTREDVFKILEK